MKSLNNRLSKIEGSLVEPKEKPTLKVFTQHVNGAVTGEGVSFKSKHEFDTYAKKAGLSLEGLPDYLLVEIMNGKDSV